ncbi:putative signal transduction histidine-protein kinase [Triangularia verruculosa]|uniref:histidine kinase n=1 Tax=Triangularia verruculosa TaxID=2587418 RepID=A0AAN7AXG2_9PEZI|nr:putative signal transduction histidine-protein kinase [Triangularia verruculosa]
MRRRGHKPRKARLKSASRPSKKAAELTTSSTTTTLPPDITSAAAVETTVAKSSVVDPCEADDSDGGAILSGSSTLIAKPQQMTGDLGSSRGFQPSATPDPPPQHPGKKALKFKEKYDGVDESPDGLSPTSHPRARDNDTTPRNETGPRLVGQGRAGKFGDAEPRDAQRQLNEYRENLARHIERREAPLRGETIAMPGPVRVSPIQEETSPPQVFHSSGSDVTLTSSTESGNTVRGGYTPGPIANTPSYPFPRMAPPGMIPASIHRPFTTLSPTVPPRGAPHGFDIFKGHDSVLSNPSTPASATTFLPPGYSQSAGEQYEFPSPNLYDLTLMLSAEPGLDAWWNTVVQIMVDVYKAERVTLAIPADSTDIENVPWGQKATYNAHREDVLSLGYLAKGSSLMPSSIDDLSEGPSHPAESPTQQQQQPPVRPGLQSRHSYTSYEDKKEARTVTSERAPQAAPRRPHFLSRSKTSHAAPTLETPEDLDDYNTTALNQQALEEHDALEEHQQQDIPSWEAPMTGPRKGNGKILNVLQALDYEADPLIDHNGVMRVLERGRVVALTRSYPYLAQGSAEYKVPDTKTPARPKSPEGTRKSARRPRSDSASKLSSLLSSATTFSPATTRAPKVGLDKKASGIGSRMEEDKPKAPNPRYEEYEQTPPSPWSQSPAPSPAVRADPNENPFFTDAMVDEDSFNPSSAPVDYTDIRPPEAIGMDNSWTVLHIPLTHVLLSKPNPAFKLDPSLMEQKISARNRSGDASAIPNSSPERPLKEKHAPIAIVSILSPLIPYPSNFRHSLDHLAPHLATSFSLCRHYTNLEIELNGLQKRRPQTAGFGALGPDGRPLADPTALASLAYAEDATRGSLAGSITSPSDYSGPSRSTAGSPTGTGTPGWEPTAMGVLRGGPTASPAPVNADSYFSSVPKMGTVTGASRSRRDSREAERRSSSRLSGGKSDPALLSPGQPDPQSTEGVRRSSEESRRSGPRESRDSFNDKISAGDKKQQLPSTPGSVRQHTQLHSYGADFASTFQSLPPSATIARASTIPAPSRSGSLSQGEMTPPSDKLKGLILDSLPAHVFVALPQTGEIVWVNSRFLSYRGQTSGDLAADPWGSIHPDDRDEYLRFWSQSVRTGEQFSRTVRIRRFDGAYRWFYARAVASKDKRGVIMQFLGSYMDIHDQHIAELRAARQEEIEMSEAKHRLLANLIPQIIFTATEDEGITFANEQWLSYTGQTFEDVLGLGFMDFVHPDDLAKCQIPPERSPSPPFKSERGHGHSLSVDRMSVKPAKPSIVAPDGNIRGIHQALSRHNSSSSGSVYELSTANLTELARKGVIRVSTDSSGRLSYTTEIRLRSKSGGYRWHLVRCVEIDNVDFGNGVSSFFGSATDINDLKLLETKLKEAMDSKSRFLSNMSHEIRTPLIGISGMVSFLQDTTLNEEQRDYTNTIQTSANSLLMIINDILDLSKVDAGMMKLNYEWFHTRSLIEDVNELVSTMAIAKRLELNYVVEEDVPAWVKGDKVRIRQVLLNVIGNAIKFTSQGEVFSRCKVIIPEGVELQENEIMLEFSVIDTGRGFTEEEAELIFKPFSQIDGSSTRQHGGSGLGLVISRQLAELHGGTMNGTAVPGKGSTFTFTARFGLPTDSDHPDSSAVPQPTPGLMREVSVASTESAVRESFQHVQSVSPQTTDSAFRSPTMASSGSSELSGASGRTQNTERSSLSSVSGLARFSEAARASGQDLSQMKLEMPAHRISPGTTPMPMDPKRSSLSANYRPPLYSILIICPQTHSREATTKHIEQTLPKDVPHQIAAVASVDEARALIGGDDSVNFTHIVVNLPTPEELISLMDKIGGSSMLGKTSILILSDSVQRQAVIKQVAGTKYDDLLSDSKVTYIYKPVKPSRFAVIFDPAKERDLSIDRNRSTAQQLVDSQRQSYIDMERRMGNKGYKVLLVEDNPVNQKVLQKYLRRVGLEVELAADGVECTEMVFGRGRGYYALILCDLHMPRKDGYQACREIRAWEVEQLLEEERTGKSTMVHHNPNNRNRTLPIIALSANVMSDVQEKCVEAGFNDYVTKPVDFIDLSQALSKFF